MLRDHAGSHSRGSFLLGCSVAARRVDPTQAGGVGCVGYYLGGKLATLTAARTDVECVGSYYGVGLEGEHYDKVAASIAYERSTYLRFRAKRVARRGVEIVGVECELISSYRVEGPARD